jgi:O-antigen ligase
MVFLFFWGILIVRMFYDIYFAIDFKLTETSQLWLYVFGICLSAVFSIIVSYKYINLEKSFYWIFCITTLILVLSLFSNQALLFGSDERQDANLAFNTIQFGHFGTSATILGIFTLLRVNLTKFKKLIVVIIITLGLFCMLRAGSRGPVVALIFVLFFLLFSRGKNLFKGIISLSTAILLTVVLIEQILTFMRNISPVMEDRLRLAIYEGDTSNRDPLYELAFKYFLESPIIGKQFAFFDSDGSFLYSHNFIMDTLMGLGIVGFVAILYILFLTLKNSYYLIHKNDPHYWISLLLLHQIIYNMMSSAFYYNQLISVLFVILFLYYDTIKRNEIGIKENNN